MPAPKFVHYASVIALPSLADSELSWCGRWYSRRLRAASHTASSAASADKTAATAKVVPKQSLPMQVSSPPP